MEITTEDLNTRVAALFAVIDDYAEADFLAAVDELAAAAPADSADALFHRASAQDSTGHPDRAVPLYEAALGRGGLTGENRRRATIQLASSLRNLGQAERALAMLQAEREQPSDHLDDALDCVTALTLAALGREREGLSLTVLALTRHLPRYNRSMAAYARALVED
jgi:hypothetical protein